MAQRPTGAAGPLLGRDAVVAVLEDILGSGRGGVVVLRGERGIGRSTCLATAAAMARARGRKVLASAGSSGEMNLPFAGLHRLLRPFLGAARALPAVQRRSLLAALGMQDAEGEDTLVLRIAVLNLLVAAAGDQGLLLSVDDAQWLDVQTHSVLEFVARRVDGHPIVLIGATSASRGEVFPGAVAREIELQRLGDAEAHRLLAHQAAHLSRSHRGWVVGKAVGNPLALRELALIAPSVDLTAAQSIGALSPLTEALQRAFAGRFPLLPGPSQDLLLVAALSLDPSLAVVLSAAALLGGHPMHADVIDAAEQIGMCTVDDRRLAFSHPLVAAAIVHQESVSRRHAAHRALAAVTAPGSRRRAWHRALGTAAPDEAVAAELEGTTPESIRRGDSAAAVEAWERAAQLSVASSERGRRFVSAASDAARLGQADAVERLLTAAADTALSAADEIRVELIRDESDVVVMADSDRMMQLCAMAAWAGATGEHDLELALMEAAARRRCAGPVGAAALDALLSLLRGRVARPGDARTVAVLALSDPVGRGREVLAAVRAARDAAVSDGDELTRYAVAARAVGDYAAAAHFFDRAEVPLRTRGLLGPLARNLCVVADLRLDLGEWDRAAAALTGYAALSTAAMSDSHRASALGTSAKIAALRGDVGAALERVAQVEQSQSARRGNRFLTRAHIARGIAYLADGRPYEAYATLRRVFDVADSAHHFREQFDAVAYLAEAAAHVAQHEQAREIVERMRSAAAESGSPFLLAHLAYADAVLAQGDDAEHLFLTALTSGSGGSAWHRGRTQLAFGRWLRRRHRIVESRSWLQLSLTAFERLGAVKWAAEALDELGAAGMAPAGAMPTALTEVLSAQELAIAQLVAAGLTNKEIAEQLYLSPRTVSSHLYRAFPKLGVTNRAQIARRMSDLQVPTDGWR